MKNLEQCFNPDLLQLASPVERVEFTGRKQIENLVQRRRPAIVKGALADWPAFGKWSPQYLKARWGDRPLYAHETAWTGKTPYLHANDDDVACRKLADFIDAIEANKDYDLYVHQAEADHWCPGSLEDLNYDALIDSATDLPKPKPNLWMGTTGTRSGLHWDNADNLIAMFYGTKAFMLADPASPRLLYPFRNNPTKSQIDPTNLDWNRFPRLRRATIFVDAIGPGDVLFLPKHWWHYFTSMQLSIMTSCWFHWNGGDHKDASILHARHFRYLLRCGPSYVLELLFQFFWHGLLRRPFERRALSPPPPGVRLLQGLRGRQSDKPL